MAAQFVFMYHICVQNLKTHGRHFLALLSFLDRKRDQTCWLGKSVFASFLPTSLDSAIVGRWSDPSCFKFALSPKRAPFHRLGWRSSLSQESLGHERANFSPHDFGIAISIDL